MGQEGEATLYLCHVESCHNLARTVLILILRYEKDVQLGKRWKGKQERARDGEGEREGARESKGEQGGLGARESKSEGERGSASDGERGSEGERGRGRQQQGER